MIASSAEDERRQRLDLRVDAAEQLALELEAEEPVAGLGLDREVADLDVPPADELAAGPRSLLGDGDPDVDGDEPGRGRASGP